MVVRDAKSARAIAAEVLRELDLTRDYAGPILDRLLEQTEERQRATDLVYGTLRNLTALDTVVTQFSINLGRVRGWWESRQAILDDWSVAFASSVYNAAIVPQSVSSADRARA